MSQLQIDKVIPKGASYPMIANFLNGYPTENFKDSNCAMLLDETRGRKSLATEVSGLLYVGEEEQEELGKTLLLARNKTTGKVRLIEVSNIDLKPYIKTDLESSTLQETSYLELSRKFGSKKNKQIAEQREKLKVNVETVTEQMQNVSQNISTDQLDLSSYSKPDDDVYIPPINREATKVQEVYETDKILNEELYEKIYDEIEHSEYMSGMIPFIKQMVTDKMSKKEVVLAVYANTLLSLYSTLMKDIIKKNFTACPFSVTLNEIVMKNFLGITNLRRIRTPQMKDKSLCHALVFLLLINNYKFDVEELCQQLKLTPRTISAKISVTGASLVTVGNKKVAQLKLPLNRPAIRRKSTKF